MDERLARPGRRLRDALAATLALMLLWGCATTQDGSGGRAEAAQPRACGERVSGETGVELAMVRRLLNDGRPRSALAHLEALGSALPEAVLMEARALREIGRHGDSRDRYKQLQDSCLQADAYHGLALLTFHEGRHGRALELMQEARRTRPTDDRIRNDLGYLLLLDGQYEAAEEELRTALELNSDGNQAASNLVLSLLQQERAAEAEQVARRHGVDQAAVSRMQQAIATQGRTR